MEDLEVTKKEQDHSLAENVSQSQPKTSENNSTTTKKWSDIADEELLLEAVNRLRIAFPDNNKEFYILLYNRLKEAKFTRFQVVSKINYVIDNYLYAKLTIGAVIQAPTTK